MGRRSQLANVMGNSSQPKRTITLCMVLRLAVCVVSCRVIQFTVLQALKSWLLGSAHVSPCDMRMDSMFVVQMWITIALTRHDDVSDG